MLWLVWPRSGWRREDEVSRIWRSGYGLILLTSLSAGALTWPADASRQAIHPGAWQFSIRRDGPYAIDGFVWDRAHPNLAVRAVSAGDRANQPAPTSRQVAPLASDERRPIAACNADFFDIGNTGAPLGLFVIDGELVSLATHGMAFAVLADGSPYLGEVNVRLVIRRADGQTIRPTRLNLGRGPDHLVLYTPAWGAATGANEHGLEVALEVDGRLTPNGRLTAVVAGPANPRGNQAIGPGRMVLSAHGDKAGLIAGLTPGERLTVVTELTPDRPIVQAVGGHPPLLRGGRPAHDPGANDPRHPRTVVGYDATQAMVAVIDGRRPGHSIGMTIRELQALAAEFGCSDALNLDGGGSSTCWVRGSVVNRPSDGRERSVANSLALLDLGPLGPPARLELLPAGPLQLARGAALSPRVTATDARFNPLAAEAAVDLSFAGEAAKLEGGRLIGVAPGTGRLIARAGAVEQTVEVTVLERVARLLLDPSRLQLLPGATAAVSVTGLDPDGRPVVLDGLPLDWRVPPELGRMVAGRLTVADDARSGNAVVAAAGAEAVLPVAVARAVACESFETDTGWYFAGFPAGVIGAVTAVPGEGGRAARLTYRLGTEPATRAAYVRLDRPIGAALGLQLRFRGDGQKVWLRAAILDGNGTRETYNLFSGNAPAAWQTVTVALPKGLKPPLTWQSVYVVATDNSYPTEGWVEWDDLAIMQVE